MPWVLTLSLILKKDKESELPEVRYQDENGNPISVLDVQKDKGRVILDCLGNGLSEEDALTLADMGHDSFEAYKLEHPRFAYLVEKKKVEYKRTLMAPITEAIKSGDSKMAQWMLERQFDDEFSGRRRTEAEKSNPIAVIINQIQMGNDGTSTIPGALKKIVHEEIETIHVQK